MGYPATFKGTLPTYSFRDQLPAYQRPASQSIDIPYRTGTIDYQYDPTSDLYLRSVDGSLQKILPAISRSPLQM